MTLPSSPSLSTSFFIEELHNFGFNFFFCFIVLFPPSSILSSLIVTLWQHRKMSELCFTLKFFRLSFSPLLGKALVGNTGLRLDVRFVS